MGRELQKKKNRSSVPKARRKPASKKRILANPVIAANWNPKETLTQNYRRLGLTSRLNKPTGGIEKHNLPTNEDGDIEQADDSLAFTSNFTKKARKNVVVDEASIERDPSTGQIIRVVESGPKPKANPLNDLLNELDEDDSGEAVVGETRDTQVIRELEELAASEDKRAPRKQSDREQDWIARLIARHGDNYRAMFWDRKLNPMQQSEGDIQKRVRKWKSKHAVSVT